MNMTKYVRLTKGLADKGILIPSDEVNSHVDDFNSDWYESIFYYNEDQYKQFQTTGSVAGITDVKTNKLIFDFDCKKDIDKARKDTLTAVERLKSNNISEKSINVFFSGNKGFTIEVKLNKFLTPKEIKKIICEKIGKGLDTLDGQIYNASRILRIPYTRHQESHLYKIPLTMSELKSLTVKLIRDKASDLNNVPDDFSITIAEPPGSFYEGMDDRVELTEVKKLDFDVSQVDFSTKPKDLDKARWLLVKGYFRGSESSDAGERSIALLCLASTYKNLGYDEEHVYRLLKGVAEKQAQRTGEERYPDGELYNNIVLQVYGPNWKGGQFTTRDPDNWLYKYAKKMGVLEQEKSAPIRIADVSSSFEHYVKHIDENTIKTGIERIDNAMPLTTGMNLGLIGAASSGKTAVALEILKNTSKAGVPSVFASLDMHRNRLFEKLLYKVSNKSRDEIYDIFASGKGSELSNKIKEDYGNVWFYDRSSPTVDKIRDYILDVEQNTGEKVKLVMIDYFERIVSDVSDDTAGSKRIAGELQDLVNDLDVCMVTLVQPNKFSLGGGPDSPIKNYTAIKGSSFLYQSFRSILSIWRPFFTPDTPEKDKFMQMAILKNDLGELKTFDFAWNGKLGSIEELEDSQRRDLERWLEEKNETKKERKRDDW